MSDLIAQGIEAKHRWRRQLRENEPFTLGRAVPGGWSIDWDDHVSRRHAQLCWRDGELEVERLSTGRNPVFFNGREVDRFHVQPGEHFVIGETTFSVTTEQATVAHDAPAPIEEQSFSSQYLRGVQFHNVDDRFEVLSRLPDVISEANNDNELFPRLVNMLLAGVRRASAVALVMADANAADHAPVNVVHWDRRLSTGGDFEPSRTLILESLRRMQSVLHVWTAGQDNQDMTFTAMESYDWAFCTPVLGEACSGWAFYVAGRFSSDLPTTPNVANPRDLREDIKFTEIVSATLSSLMQVRRLQRKQATLSQFFPPAVLEALENQVADDVLAPRETHVSVLFCDLRGFSLKAEQDAENLLGLLQRVSKALGVMTHHILDQGGVVGDFQGDAAMGFWGWPLAQKDTILRACLAALAIRLEFEAAARRPGHPLNDFRVGIGLATGRAVAGGIGTIDQLKVTVFGPVVNLASRLEGMTKFLYAPILIDDATAKAVRQGISRDLARCRRVAKVKPYGMDTEVEVNELLPPESEHRDLTDEHIAAYERALDAFINGDWPDAMEMLQEVPARDQVKDFLTGIITQHNRRAPANWEGVISLDRKS